MFGLLNNKAKDRKIYENLVFGAINNFLDKFVVKTSLSRRLYNFYGRILPIPEIVVRGVPIKVIIPLNQVGVYDTVKNWEEREPEVLDWIDNFEKGCIFFDVGAGFGTETLYAALKRSGPHKIVSFDISLESSFNLAYNIMLNNITNVEQYFMALSNNMKLISHTEPTQYYFVKGREKFDYVSYKTISISMDQFTEMTDTFPEYIKIDVDGAEENIISGMNKTIKNSKLRSVVIEVSNESEIAIKHYFKKAGFTIDCEIELNEKFKNIIFKR